MLEVIDYVLNILSREILREQVSHIELILDLEDNQFVVRDLFLQSKIIDRNMTNCS